MSATLSLTESQTFAALRTVLLALLPAGIEVIRAEVNRVAEPAAPDFVVMSPTLRDRLSTDIDTFTDQPVAVPPVALRNTEQRTQVTIQLDIHGPNSADNAQKISTLMRSEYATIAFAATGLPIQPLYAESPRQAPFINGENQYECRWTVDVVLQANPVVGTPQDFAGEIEITLIESDPPSP